MPRQQFRFKCRTCNATISNFCLKASFILASEGADGYTVRMVRLVACFGLAWACASLSAGDEVSMKKTLAQWEQQLKEWHAAEEQAVTPQEKDKVLREYPDGADIASALWKAVDTKSFKEEWACPVVVWWLNHIELFKQIVPPNELQKSVAVLWKSVDEVHYQNPLIAEACAVFSQASDVRVYRMLEKIYAANPNERAKGCAALALALFLDKTNVLSEAEWGGREMKRAKRVFYVREALLKAPNEDFGTGCVGDIAAEEVYRLRYLTENALPPLVTVKDRSGRAVTLPVRDKYTILFFCTPDDEESISVLSKRAVFQSQYGEFAFCPVITGVSRNEAVQRLSERGIVCDFYSDDSGDAAHAWRVHHSRCSAGRQDDSGDVAHQWRVRRLPAVALISDKGRLLYWGASDMNFQAKLDECKQKIVEKDHRGRQSLPTTDKSSEQPIESSRTPDLRPLPDFE